MRRFLIAATLVLITAGARGESAAPVNSAYDQLPTMSEAPTGPMDVEPLPALEQPARALAYPASTEPWTAPAPASTLAPPRTQPSYVPQGQEFATCDACINCGSGCVLFGAYPPHSFWFGAIELTMLQPSYDTGFFGIDDDRGSVGPRLIFGWESPRGLGFRSRFWGLNNTSRIVFDDPNQPPPAEMDIDAGRFDFDVYRRFTFDGSSLAVGASITAAGLELDPRPLFAPIKESGGGVGFFVEGRHEFYSSPIVDWAVISRGRWAGLVGEWQSPGPGRDRGDTNLEILEASLGLEYKRKFRRCDFLFQYSIEAQAWRTTVINDLSFLGSTASFGLNW